jgi:hypothetical protein
MLQLASSKEAPMNNVQTPSAHTGQRTAMPGYHPAHSGWPQGHAEAARAPAVGDVPSGRRFIALLEAFRNTGGTAPGEIVGRLLQEHQCGDAVSLAKLVFTGQVFGFEWRENLWIPMCQFDPKDLALKPAPQQVRAELPALWPGWTTASWFAAPNAWLAGEAPVDLLNSNLPAVLQAARSTRWHEGTAAISLNADLGKVVHA